jgi:Leucine-rich repeat (LRR) protein
MQFVYIEQQTMITICGKEYSADITALCLAYQGLTTIPEEIKYFTNLEYLDLSNNQITAIPEHIFDSLINLRWLHLYHNKITTIPGHVFDSLINLRELYLFENQITAVPENIFDNMTNLIRLSIHDNQITAIPEHLFDSLTNLKYLYLNKNNITAIPEHIFDNLTNLYELDLSKNKITEIPDHIFDSLINLHRLYLYNSLVTTIPQHIFDRLTNLEILNLSDNQITVIPISILNCRRLVFFHCSGNPIERIDVRIQRFIDNNRNYKTHGFFNDSQNVHSSSIQSSIKESIDSLMKDPFTIDKEDIIKQLIEESPSCLQSLLCYLDDKYVHSTLYLTFFDLFVKVWGRIIGSDFKADLIKRLDEEMMDSECKCFTGRMSRLVNVLVGFFSDINITVSNNERIGAIISSVLKGREMTDELKEVCRKSLKKAEIEEDEIGKWLDG